MRAQPLFQSTSCRSIAPIGIIAAQQPNFNAFIDVQTKVGECGF
jgi:hypothetical protein